MINKKIKTVILGGGAAGLILGTLLKNSIVIDKNPMGQLNTPFIPGPRIFKYSKHVLDFLKKYSDIDFKIKTINIGYIDKFNKEVNLTDEFKKEYSLITRNINIVEKSFLSSGETSIDIFSNGDDSFYSNIFNNLFHKIENRIIKDSVEKIDTKNNLIYLLSGEVIEYDECISTLNLNILLKLIGLKENTFNLSTSFKHFVQCEYVNTNDIENRKKYHYMYSTNGEYTRKTYFKDYIVYELTQSAVDKYNITKKELQKDFLMSICNSNFVLRNIFNLPFQIDQSIDINRIQGIHLCGRYAQWNHKIKANEIIEKFNFYI